MTCLKQILPRGTDVRSLILIYHGTNEAGGGNVNPHLLPTRNVVEQIEHLAQHRYPVISWRENAATAADDTVRIGLTFDDGYRSDLENARSLSAHGYDALFFIATEYIGLPAYLDQTQIKELKAMGMCIGSHSHHHSWLAPMSDKQVEWELSHSKQVLEDIVEAPVRDLSFPGGSYDGRVVAIGRRLGYQRFFTSDWGLNADKQFVGGVLRRTSVLNTLDGKRFDALLRRRSYAARHALFAAKEWTKRAIGDDRYVKLRRALLDRVR
jgi:peptidoglycan/xylan/chitin deacetylase (PgdA/CDA1 family)